MAHARCEIDIPLSKTFQMLSNLVDFPKFFKGIDKVVKINTQVYEFEGIISDKKYGWTINVIDNLKNTRLAWITINGDLNQTGTIRFVPLDFGTEHG